MLFALLSALLFGAATPASKPLLAELTPFQLAGLLYLGASLGVLPFVLGRRGRMARWRTDRGSTLRLSGAILWGGVLGPVLLLAALRIAGAASVSLWLNLELVATAVLGRLFFRDHLGRFGWLAVLGAVFGGAVLSVEGGAAGVRAGFLVALACACWGMDNHLTALIDGITPAESTLWKGLFAGAVNLAIGVAAAPCVASPQSVAFALAVGALSYGASIALYISAAQALGATRAQVLFAAAPFFGAALSFAVLGERPSLPHFAAATLMAGSIALLFRDRHEHLHAHPALAHEHSHRHDDGHHTHVHAGEPQSLRHTHPHEHEPVTHAHPHWPDLHHRHGH